MDTKQLSLMLDRCSEPMRSTLRAHIEALLADNAALFEIGERLHSLAQHDEACRMLVGDDITMCDCAIGKWREVQRQRDDHPGAALLSEMEALRKRMDDAERERDEARAQVATARAAALEEAADTIRQGLAELAKMPTPTKGHESLATLLRNLLEKCVSEIEALATTPPPPVVPVSKVREVLRGIYETSKHIRDGIAQRDVRYAEHSGRMGASFAAARDLGINLDGEP